MGKTELALAVAERLGAVILSCDAYCVYRGMDIGTAKPSAKERARVPHEGIDLVPVSEPFSIDRYLEASRACLQRAQDEGRPVLVAGGSGFYLKSFFSPVMDTIPVSVNVRERVAAIERAEGLGGLQIALRACGSVAKAVGFDWDNPRRVSNALERCLASGRSLDAVQSAFFARPEPYPEHRKIVCLLEREVEALHARIVQRVDAMLAAGLINEVRALREEGLASNPTAEAAIGYRETLAYLRGEIASEAALRDLIIIHTRQLARKQRTWLRRQIPVDRRIQAATATPLTAFPEVFL